MARAPAGRKKDGVGRLRSFVPDGTRFIFAPQPSDESLGYFRASLQDVESRHAKRVPSLQEEREKISGRVSTARDSGGSTPPSRHDRAVLCENVRQNFPVHVRQAAFDAVVVITQPLMVESEKV